MQLDVNLDRRNLAKFRTLLKASRLMAAKSLTFTAERAVPAWRAGHSVFHKRNTWIDRGVRMRAATPAELSAKVGSLDRYMTRHVVGINEPKKGRLFIPIYRRIGEALTHTRERRALARMEGTRRKPFRWHHDGETFLARRKGKARSPLVILGKFQSGAKVQPRLDAEAIVGAAVQREFPTVYARLLEKWAETGRG